MGNPGANLERRIFSIRGQRVMFDVDLARLYGVSTKRLNQQVRRNIDRFPRGFLMELSSKEVLWMKLQNATSSKRNFQRPPLAFTEHGAIMLATVLSTPVAVAASVRVVRAFVRMREILSTQALLQKKLDELEDRVLNHDLQLEDLFDSFRKLISPRRAPRKKIGFSPSF